MEQRELKRLAKAHAKADVHAAGWTWTEQPGQDIVRIQAPYWQQSHGRTDIVRAPIWLVCFGKSDFGRMVKPWGLTQGLDFDIRDRLLAYASSTRVEPYPYLNIAGYWWIANPKNDPYELSMRCHMQFIDAVNWQPPKESKGGKMTEAYRKSRWAWIEVFLSPSDFLSPNAPWRR